MKNFLGASEGSHFIILYGSQLKQAEGIAENLRDVSQEEHDLKCSLFTLNEVTDIKDLTKVNCPIVIVTSTTGDGDPPENADKFWRKLRRKTLDSKTLLLVRYTILGLGDTNYNNFCNCGKTIHKRLQELGATLFYPPGWADDGTGLELVVDDWIQGLWPALKRSVGIKTLPKPEDILLAISQGQDQQSSSPPKQSPEDPKMSEVPEVKTLTLPALPNISLIFEYSDEPGASYALENPPTPYPLSDGDPVLMTISNAKLLTRENAVKTALEVSLTFQTENQFDFQPGDSVGIVCRNHFGEVEELLTHLDCNLKADKRVDIRLDPGVPKGKIPPHIPSGSTLRDLFTFCCDIRTTPKKPFLRLLAQSCTEELEKNTLLEWSSRQGIQLYRENVLDPAVTLLDLFLRFPSCKPKVEALVEHLPRLQPRAYSICSTPLKSSSSFEIAFNIIEVPKLDSPRQYNRYGVCTGWLYDVLQHEFPDQIPSPPEEKLFLDPVDSQIRADVNESKDKTVIVYLRKNQSFRLPEKTSSPLIMVGPGTGVAPFIGFLQHRQMQKVSGEDSGQSFLYFGCRHKEKDFLYEEDLEGFTKSDALTKLYVSFSRDEAQDGIKYVQDWMLKNKSEIVSLLSDQEGYIYVCGDAKNMAKNVREALASCFRDVKELDERAALSTIANLVSSKRYLQDVWA